MIKTNYRLCIYVINDLFGDKHWFLLQSVCCLETIKKTRLSSNVVYLCFIMLWGLSIDVYKAIFSYFRNNYWQKLQNIISKQLFVYTSKQTTNKCRQIWSKQLPNLNLIKKIKNIDCQIIHQCPLKTTKSKTRIVMTDFKPIWTCIFRLLKNLWQ